MAPWWKIRREFLRLFAQVGGLGELARGRRARRHYDRHERAAVVIHEGDRPAGPELAIVLIYQPDGLLPSLFFQLDYLRAQHLDMVLVANHPLGAEDVQRLNPYCHLIIERPNRGYDFGGYREGILTLLDRELAPERLFVMNDSVWFPLRRDCSLIETARASRADAFGIFRNTKSRRDAHHNLQSYFYCFSGALLRDGRFRDFWQNMPFFSSKRLVIRRLEVTISSVFESWGYEVASLVTPDDVAGAGARLTDAELQEVSAFHVSTTLRGREIFKHLVKMRPGDPGWRAERDRVLTESRFRYYYIDAHPLVLFRHLDTPFLKKSREYHYYVQREALIAGGFHLDFDPIIQREVAGWNDAGQPGPPEDKAFPPLAERRASSSARSSGKSS